MTKFDAALAVVLKEEGGKVDLKSDPGGRTAFGVTQRTFDAWQGAHGLPRRDVWTITPAEVAAIYRNAYADPVHFDSLPPGVDLCVLDDAINSGPHEAACELQRAVGVAADGAIGALTLAAARKLAPVVLIGRLCDARLGFMRRLRTWTIFSRGWTARVETVRAAALAMARAPVVLHPVTATALSLTNMGFVIDKPAPCDRSDCPLHPTGT